MIRKAIPQDASAVSALALLLWTDNDPTELEADMAALLRQEDAAVFLAENQGQAVGFAQCQLRHDYVEGTSTSPVGYLEGVYVAPDARRTGLARRLVAACRDWARAKGCAEFASDCELDNEESLRFHLAAGFEEANRIICFTQRL